MKIFLLADYYSAYLKAFYGARDVSALNYRDHHATLMSDYFGSFVSYYNHFRRIGHDVMLVIGNDHRLQQKWLQESGSGKRSRDKYDVVLQQLRTFQPDALFMGSMFDYYGPFLKKASEITKNIFVWIACPFSKNLDFSSIRCILTSAPEYLSRFSEPGVPAEVLRAAFDGDILARLDETKTIDVSFIGGLSKKHHGKRVEGLETLLCQGIPLEVYGYGLRSPWFSIRRSRVWKNYHGELWGLNMYQTMSSSRISLNFHIDVAAGFSGNMRLYETTGSGSLLLTEETKSIADLFEAGKELIVYNTTQDLAEKIRYYLKHEDERALIAQAGQKTYLERHGYSTRIREFERILLRYTN